MVAESDPSVAQEADPSSITLDEQKLPTILLVKALKNVTQGAEVFNCSAAAPCHLCVATAEKYGTRTVKITPGVDDGEFASGVVPAHAIWRLLMEEPQARAGLTIRQRALLRDMVIPTGTIRELAANSEPENPLGEAARVLEHRGVLLWAPGEAPLNSDIDPSDLAPPAWVFGCFDEESARHAEEGNVLAPKGEELLAAFRDAMLAAARHGDTDALELLGESATVWKLSDADKDILLADITWLLIKGAMSRELAAWLFGPEGPAVFDGWRYSDVPLIVVGHSERSMLSPGEQAEGSGVTGLAEAAVSLLEFLHGLGFKGAESGRTLLVAVRAASFGVCDMALLDWLVNHKCPAGPAGMAYACAIGTDKDVRPPEAMKVVGYLARLGVPMGPLALEDLWRLPAEAYKEYVDYMGKHGCPVEDRAKLYHAATVEDYAFKHLQNVDKDFRKYVLIEAGLAPDFNNRAAEHLKRKFEKLEKLFKGQQPTTVWPQVVVKPLNDLITSLPPTCLSPGGPYSVVGSCKGSLRHVLEFEPDFIAARAVDIAVAEAAATIAASQVVIDDWAAHCGAKTDDVRLAAAKAAAAAWAQTQDKAAAAWDAWFVAKDGGAVFVARAVEAAKAATAAKESVERMGIAATVELAAAETGDKVKEAVRKATVAAASKSADWATQAAVNKVNAYSARVATALALVAAKSPAGEVEQAEAALRVAAAATAKCCQVAGAAA
ncbi:hypothetical protein HYH02_007263 [Chlamydomonas schloesseri]|uniref:Uncharacterized protein n=1 Tax=Chlamydomonas schloesseri TaxID=2026947 RepID=A0A835WI19_9CHLO|nr:hypothetical protein HYH02_007263 [Chlamydomonas schloesseri]|eukprot:KAG2447806.1 hypothetical protein HYH02_007263 [Chlamydomonas schloesseri]